jgi:hypothetical protein
MGPASRCTAAECHKIYWCTKLLTPVAVTQVATPVTKIIAVGYDLSQFHPLPIANTNTIFLCSLPFGYIPDSFISKIMRVFVF